MQYIESKDSSTDVKEFSYELEPANRQLICVGNKIRFKSKRDLKAYIEESFNEIFPDLILFKIQHSNKMPIGDLLCCTKLLKQPVIIELRNEEDSSLVSQVSRYRKAILTEKPFADQINYSLPVRLVAIAPSFNKDNYLDKEVSKFNDSLCFWEYSVEKHNNSGQFKIGGNTYDIPYPILGLLKLPLILKNYSSLSPTKEDFSSNIPEKYRSDFQNLRLLLISQPKVKEMVDTTNREILYGTGEGENHRKLAKITNTSRGLSLFLWLPTKVKTNIKIPVTRFGFVFVNGDSPFSKNSLVEWLVCSKDTIHIQDEPHANIDLASNRHSMMKWCPPNLYLAQATSGSSNTFWLLMYLIKGIKPPIDDATLTWWESYKTQTPADLGWYIDLAIKTWNYRIK